MKKVRHKAILDLVRSQEIASQEELAGGILAAARSTSRSRLCLATFRNWVSPRPAGIIPSMGAEPPRSSDESLRRIFVNSFEDVAVAQNIVVVKTGPGHASTVSQAIDEAGWAEIVGSLAGDDTVFVAVRIREGKTPAGAIGFGSS